MFNDALLRNKLRKAYIGGIYSRPLCVEKYVFVVIVVETHESINLYTEDNINVYSQTI